MTIPKPATAPRGVLTELHRQGPNTSGNDLLDSLLSFRPSLRSAVKEIALGRGEYLFQDGEISDWICFPTTAVVGESKSTSDGLCLDVAVTGREGMVGFNAAFDPEGSANTAQVYICGRAFNLQARSLAKAMNDPRVANTVGSFLADHARRLAGKVICGRYHSAEARLCAWVLTLHDRIVRTGENRTLPVSHEQIAAAVGAYRPTVSNLLAILRDEGAIDYGRSCLSVTNAEKLRDAACGCYTEY